MIFLVLDDNFQYDIILDVDREPYMVMSMGAGRRWVMAIACAIAVFASVPAAAQFGDLSRFERAKDAYRKGIVFYNRMQYLAAVEHFRAAVAVYPDYHTAREYLARSYRFAGYTDEALKEWEILANISPHNVAVQGKIDALRFRRVGGATAPESAEFVFASQIESNDQTRYRFPRPVDCAVDRDKNVYLSSFSTGKVVKFDANGEGIGTFTTALGSKIYGIDIFDDTVAMTDFQNDVVFLTDRNFRAIKQFGSKGAEAGRFHGPEGVSFDRNGYLYVVDSGNHRVQKFDAAGGFVLAFGQNGAYEGQLNYPSDVTVIKDRVFVSDSGNKRLACFDDSGNFLRNIGVDGMEGPRGLSEIGGRLVVADEKKGLMMYNPETDVAVWPDLWKNTKGGFSKLFAASFDRDGFLYCVDHHRETLSVFSPLQSRYSNLDLEITSVDTRKYPIVAVYCNVCNRRGMPVHNLLNKNFRITEDSARISGVYVDYLKDLDPSVSVVLCVDRSSVAASHHGDLPWAAEFLLRKMCTNDALKVMNFNSDYWTGNDFDWSRRRALQSLKEREYRPGKDFGRALYNALNDVVPRITRRAVVVLTDGSVEPESFRRYSADTVIEYARSHYIPITVVAFRQAAPELARIARETGGSVIRVQELDALRGLYDRVKGQEEYRYVLVYYSFKIADLKGWWSDLRIDVDYLGQKGTEWGGYFVP